MKKRRPWSKLQRDLYNIMDYVDFQIHCAAYRMPGSRSSRPQIPRYWITIGKEIIWDFPADTDGLERYSLYEHIQAISDWIRDYINCPRNKISSLSDPYKLLDIFMKYDRRFK